MGKHFKVYTYILYRGQYHIKCLTFFGGYQQLVLTFTNVCGTPGDMIRLFAHTTTTI